MNTAASPELTDASSSSSGGGKKRVTIAEEENVVVEPPPRITEDEEGRRTPGGKVKIDLKTSRIKSNEEVEAEREARLAQSANAVQYKVKLERVLGLTVPSNAGLASSPATGIVAYPAGCTAVLYNPRKNRQSHVTNLSRKTITSVGFSEDGRYLVTGECGHLPSVRIWDVHDKSMVAEFSGHKFGINCVAFAPNNKYVVSVGSQHDMIVNVWDWKNNVKVASNKISTKVKAISFSENGNYFVTAGNRHVKFWYLEYSRSKYKDPMPLMGRSAILGEQRNNYFCDVSCGRGEMGDSTYAITKSGLLCEFNNRRLLDKWVELRTQTANCLSVGEDYIFIGCGDGIVRCFSPHTLQFITTLPRTHYLGVDVSKGLSISHMATHPPTAKYPDAKAITYDEQNFKVTVVYNDHSIYVWDVRDIKKVGKSHSFIFHSACIWGLEIYSSLGGGDPGKKTGGSQKPVLPPGSFITCSSDDTIRIWNLSSNMSQSTLYRRNIYSDELLKTLYVDSELNHLKELDNSNLEKASGQSGGETVVDQRNGVRCIRISPDGKHLASGDRAGNIRVHDLQFMDEICKIEAHDAEVLCLEYCGPLCDARGKYLLASASRDRLIHIFNATRDYKFLTTLDDHSSSITAVKFLPAPHEQMVSCGADKSIIFRDISVEKNKGVPEFSRGTHVVGKTTLYDMEVDHNAKHILTACQDRNIRIYTVGNGKHLRTFKGSVSDDGTLIKVVLDHSGLYAATSCTDKTLAIYDYYTGECMATMFGHSELVTGLKFTEDCKHLISVSGDGCIFIWRLPHEMTANMIGRLSSAARKDSSSRVYIGSSNSEEFFGSPPRDMMTMHPTVNRDEEDDSYRFSVGKLPFWAKKQMTEQKPAAPPSSSPPKSPSAKQQAQQGVDYPKGRWAQRVGSRGMTVKSHYDSDSVIPFPQKFDSSDGKDSGSFDGYKQQKDLMDEGFDYNSLSEVDRGSSPQEHSLKDIKSQRSKLRLDALPSHLRNPEHDADIDDYSDGLTTQDDGGESTEPENTERTMYFGQSEETPGVYTVNAMDVEELRRSQRRSKKPERSSEPLTTPSQEDSDSDDSDDDEEEEVSTPSADKNILSLLSVSSENVDLVGRRERFLQSNFESLGNSSGLVIDSNSFSNQYREGSALMRNASTIARAQSFRDNEQNRKREELQRRIEETKRKLQNIGYRSMIKGSQSISDLSTHIPEKDFSEGSRPTSRSSARGLVLSPSSCQRATLSETDVPAVSLLVPPPFSSHSLERRTRRRASSLLLPESASPSSRLRRTLSARSNRVRHLKKSSLSCYSSDSDSSSQAPGPAFGNYLSSLSACPSLGLCRQLSMPVADLPSLSDESGSLFIKEEKISPRKERVVSQRLREMAAKFELDEMLTMEKELQFLERELFRRHKKRSLWGALAKRISKEVFGKFNDNIRLLEDGHLPQPVSSLLVELHPESKTHEEIMPPDRCQSSPTTPHYDDFPPRKKDRRTQSLSSQLPLFLASASPPLGTTSMWVPMTPQYNRRHKRRLARRVSLQNLSSLKQEIVSGKKSSSTGGGGGYSSSHHSFSSKQHWKSTPSYGYHHQKGLLHGPPVLSERPIANRNGKHLGMHKGGPELFYGEDVPSYMRSTSASVKKEKTTTGGGTQSNTIPRRKTSIGQMASVSTSDLRSHSNSTKEGGVLLRMEDSSSEENSDRKAAHAAAAASASSGRRRSSSQDRRHSILRNSVESGLNSEHRARSERDLSKVTKVKVRAHSREDPFLKKSKMKSTTLILSNNNNEEEDLDNQSLEGFDLRQRRGGREGLVDKTAAALLSAADNLVQCYKQIAIDYDLNDNLKAELLGRLAKSAGSATSSLSPINNGYAHGALAMTTGKQESSNGGYPSDLQSNPYFLHMLENYSNMMLSQQSNRDDPRRGGGFNSSDHHHQGPSWC